VRTAARALLLTLLGAVLPAAGCHSTAACKPGTLLLAVDVGDAGGQAARISVRVLGAGDRLLSSGEVDRPAGQRSGTIEVRFAGSYPAGQTVSIQVQARRGDQALAAGAMTARLEPGCAVLSLSLERSADAGTDAPGASPPDGGLPDVPGTDAEAAGPDAEADAALPADAAPNAEADAGTDAGTDPSDAGAPADADPPPDAPATGAARRVFVTSSRHTGNLGGLNGAHAICQSLADAAGLSGSYKAWLSSSLSGPASFMVHSTVPYMLVTGQRVADSWNDLVDGSLRHAIDRDERGQEIRPQPFVCEGGEVWSNTDTAGSPRGLDDCLGWSSMASTSSNGDLNRNDRRWTEGDCSNKSCQYDLPFYCFEQ
jgi:hypothetical protein